jgi:putative transposase
MNDPKCDELDYIHFLVAAQKVYSNTEAAKCHPLAGNNGPAHDAYTRLLHRCQSDEEALWQEVKECISLKSGVLVIDDTTLDKQYARVMELVTRHWSGKHHSVVMGINLITLLWTGGDDHWPCDFRIYDKPNDGLSKNDHFAAMLKTAAKRGFKPELVAFDSWYASLENLKLVRSWKWHWLTQLKSNRLVDPDGSGNRPISDLLIPRHGAVVHLKGYGFIKAFKIVAPNGDIEYWATDNMNMTIWQCADYADYSWQIEEYHRGLKQFCGVERAQHRSGVAQRNHIGLAIRAFLRLESYRIRTGVSWFEAKASIVRDAIRTYLTNPLYVSVSTA